MPRPSAAPAPATSEPLTRGTLFHSMAAGVLDLWGEEGLRDVIARLPEETRAATAGPSFTTLTWYPTRYVLDWDLAKMAGPARGDEAAFLRSVARTIDLGFGRIRRSLLTFATPVMLAERAAQLWRHDHTHGELSVDPTGRREGHAVATLTNHLFTTTPMARMAFAEVIRHVLSLSRARNVRESHAPSGEALVVTLRWDV